MKNSTAPIQATMHKVKPPSSPLTSFITSQIHKIHQKEPQLLLPRNETLLTMIQNEIRWIR